MIFPQKASENISGQMRLDDVWSEHNDYRPVLTAACKNEILKYAIQYIDFGLSISTLIKEGKKEALKACLEFNPHRGLSFDLYFGWRIKSRFHELHQQSHNRHQNQQQRELLPVS